MKPTVGRIVHVRKRAVSNDWQLGDGRPRKPIIRCNCGHVSGIGLHHVHADGRVTNSFYHKRGPEDPEGCEWHVWLKLAGWDMGDIPPDPK